MNRGLTSTALIAATLGAALGCSSGGDTAAFSIEVLPTSCESTSTPVPVCAKVRVCPAGTFDGTVDATAECFALAAPDGSHSDGVKDGLFVHVGADARVTFDGKLSGSRFDIEVVGYDDAGEAVLVGEARDVTLSKSTRLRLYNVAAANCVENGTLSARALHVAVPLPNGDVLFLGGVRGENVGAKTPAQFQSAVELYDASADTFRVLKGSDGDEAIFLRVMFAAFGPRSGAGPYRIRVYGGYTANTDAGGDAVDVFPVLLPGEPDDTKVRPNDAAVAAPPVDVVVDPARGTVDFVPVDDSGVDATGWATGAQMDDRAAVLFSVPFDSPGCWTKDSLGSPTTCAHSVVYDLDPGANFAAVRNRDTGVPRLGGTISLGTAAALVWGGPVAHTVLEVAAGAGYVLPSSAAQADVAVANAAPTGFQSSTTLADGRVLLLGGLLSGCATPADVACTDKGILQSTYVTPSARVVTLGGGAGATVTDAIGLASFQASVFHSATPMRVGDEDGLLVVGGMASDAGSITSAARPGVTWVRAPSGVEPTLGDADGRVPTETSIPRWGHTATALGGDRVLVVGGFTPQSSTPSNSVPVRAVTSAEVLSFERLDGAAGMCAADGG